ncbi:MAG: helix-turn-helix transcriptional regulator [Sphingomonas bacterium]
MRPISSERLSALIGLIYDAAIDPHAWGAALEAIRAGLRAEIAAVNLQAVPDGSVLLNITSNIPAHHAERMGGYGAEVMEIWGGAAAMMSLPLDQPAILSRVNPGALDFATTRNRYALEWAQPQQLIDSLAIGLARDRETLGSISFGRHRRVGKFDERAIELARLLIPHLQRAATVNRLLEMSGISRANFASVLEDLAIPVALVAADMRIVHANARARALIGERDILHERHGFLAAADAGIGRALAAAVRQAAAGEEGAGRGFGIAARRNGQGAAALYVMPLGHRLGWGRREAAAAVLVAASGGNFMPSAEIVSGLFGLTGAEARVFPLLAAGIGPAEVAARLNVAPSTVKTHALRIYEKTGVGRQAELVQLAASLAVPLMPNPVADAG